VRGNSPTRFRTARLQSPVTGSRGQLPTRASASGIQARRQSSERAPHDSLGAVSWPNGQARSPMAIPERTRRSSFLRFFGRSGWLVPRWLSGAVKLAPVPCSATVSRPPHSISIRNPPAAPAAGYVIRSPCERARSRGLHERASARLCAIVEPDETELVPPFLWTVRLDAPPRSLSGVVELALAKAISRPPHCLSIRDPPAAHAAGYVIRARAPRQARGGDLRSARKRAGLLAII